MDLPWTLYLFYLFAAVLVVSALGVISVKNSVHAALLLVLCFFTTSALWLLLQAEFLAVALVLVYVGAVMVLFLFVVMMLDIKVEPMREGFIRYLPVGLIVAVVMLVEMLGLMGVKSMNITAPADPAGASNTAWLGKALFTQFLLPFEVAAVILTVAVIAAIMLTLRKRAGTKYQQPSWQVSVHARDRVRIVKMASSTPVEVPAGEAKP
ncbi:MAG TPA: NADH-quinone oxidoreductase subunit J [Rudaea sp.]|jgi:NADH-quinone oxidoreductase subunit J|nr:NADH-quinone oxidoreductase subunit J [Rudaea sp.]